MCLRALRDKSMLELLQTRLTLGSGPLSGCLGISGSQSDPKKTTGPILSLGVGPSSRLLSLLGDTFPHFWVPFPALLSTLWPHPGFPLALERDSHYVACLMPPSCCPSPGWFCGVAHYTFACHPITMQLWPLAIVGLGSSGLCTYSRLLFLLTAALGGISCLAPRKPELMDR